MELVCHFATLCYNFHDVSEKVFTMKKIFLSAIVLCGVTTGPAFAIGGFAKTCTNTALSGTALVAKCKTAAGAVVDAKLEMNGNLMPSGTTMMLMQGAPTFTQSRCTNLAVAGSILTATCNDKAIKYDLNNSVGNYNGVLKFN